MSVESLDSVRSATRIVIADDPIEQLLLAQVFHEIGTPDVTVEFVTEGARLLELLTRRQREGTPVDLVVVGADAPLLNIEELLTTLSLHPRLWCLPVLVWAEEGDLEEAQRCCDNGALWYELRPTTMEGYERFATSLVVRARRAAQLRAESRSWAAVVDITTRRSVLDLTPHGSYAPAV